jgi:arylsulfatase A-like enzyme
MRRPNILFMVSHDLGRHLGCYGVATVRSPNLDRLAAEGVRLSNSFCVAPQCSPSRAALFTGRYPHSNGVMGLTHAGFGWDLNPGERHMADLLREAGYRTALVGVQHERRRAEDTRYDSVDLCRPVRTAQTVKDRAVACLEEMARGYAPFFLQVGFFEPHRRFDHGGATPDREAGVTVPPFVKDEPSSREDFAAYQGAIRSLDTGVGGILDAVDRLGLRENTLVVFTVDHGMPFPLAKCSLYDPGLEVAFLARWPERGWNGGRVCDPMIPNIDMLPTMLAALGVETPGSVQGRSFLALLDGRPYGRRAEMFAEMTDHDYYDPMRCIRTETHKLIVFFSYAKGYMNPTQQLRPLSAENDKWSARWPDCRHETVELYDLRSEPWEKTNRAQDPACAETRRRLLARLHDWMVETDDPLLRGAVTCPPHEQALAALREAAGQGGTR